MGWCGFQMERGQVVKSACGCGVGGGERVREIEELKRESVKGEDLMCDAIMSLSSVMQ